MSCDIVVFLVCEVIDEVSDVVDDEVIDDVIDEVIDEVIDKVIDEIIDVVDDEIIDKVIDEVSDVVDDEVIDEVIDVVDDEVDNAVIDAVIDVVIVIDEVCNLILNWITRLPALVRRPMHCKATQKQQMMVGSTKGMPMSMMAVMRWWLGMFSAYFSNTELPEMFKKLVMEFIKLAIR